MINCQAIFNRDNGDTHRYEVWCVVDGERRFICWVSDKENTDHITGVIKAMGGTDVEFKDKEIE